MSPAGGRSPADARAGLTRVVDDRTDETIGPMKGRSVHGSGVMRPRAAVAHRSRGEAQRRCRPSQRTARMILLRGARQPHGTRVAAGRQRVHVDVEIERRPKPLNDGDGSAPTVRDAKPFSQIAILASCIGRSDRSISNGPRQPTSARPREDSEMTRATSIGLFAER